MRSKEGFTLNRRMGNDLEFYSLYADGKQFSAVNVTIKGNKISSTETFTTCCKLLMHICTFSVTEMYIRAHASPEQQNNNKFLYIMTVFVFAVFSTICNNISCGLTVKYFIAYVSSARVHFRIFLRLIYTRWWQSNDRYEDGSNKWMVVCNRGFCVWLKAMRLMTITFWWDIKRNTTDAINWFEHSKNVIIENLLSLNY